MADRAVISATLQHYYDAWETRDHELYRTVWAEGAAFADPPTDGEVPPTGFDQILAGMEEVWSRADSITYDRHRMWHCGHSVAVHSTVVMKIPDALAHVPLIHVFRFDDEGLIRRLEAFLDFDQVEMVEGDRPDWMPLSA
ncbi:MAG: nuclear transport factor 2 family protein [Actinomycetia bacterium]|nr:nuclear transport factor 2 family protein [Actinomycetes bacterium]